MFSKEKLEEIGNAEEPSVSMEQLITSHLDLYEITETTALINNSDSYLDLEEAEEEADILKKELLTVQEEIQSIKLQLVNRSKNKTNSPEWLIKAQSAITYKGKQLIKLQNELSLKNTEIKQLRRVVNNNNMIQYAKQLMTPEQWVRFKNKITSHYTGADKSEKVNKS